jgi:hypothetical protein
MFLMSKARSGAGMFTLPAMARMAAEAVVGVIVIAFIVVYLSICCLFLWAERSTVERVAESSLSHLETNCKLFSVFFQKKISQSCKALKMKRYHRPQIS